MPKGANQKLKLYYLSQIMTEKTDDEHMITMPEMGVVRTTYLIDENGVIIRAQDKVKAADNPEEMLEILQK